VSQSGSQSVSQCVSECANVCVCACVCARAFVYVCVWWYISRSRFIQIITFSNTQNL